VSVEENKAVVRHALDCLNAGHVDGFVGMLAADYVRHCQAMPPEMQELRGPDAMRAWLMANQQTFPDYREEIEALIGEGDFIAWRSLGTGTQTGPMGPLPATGRRMAISIIGLHRVENGKLAETWTSWDNVAAPRQLGLLSA
jgi:steroid delta-isomerase-like uncharacterized protein